jgi:hypothetical protein
MSRFFSRLGALGVAVAGVGSVVNLALYNGKYYRYSYSNSYSTELHQNKNFGKSEILRT